MRNAGIDVVQVNSFPLPSFYVLQTLHEHTHTHENTCTRRKYSPKPAACLPTFLVREMLVQVYFYSRIWFVAVGHCKSYREAQEKRCLK